MSVKEGWMTLCTLPGRSLSEVFRFFVLLEQDCAGMIRSYVCCVLINVSNVLLNPMKVFITTSWAWISEPKKVDFTLATFMSVEKGSYFPISLGNVASSI